MRLIQAKPSGLGVESQFLRELRFIEAARSRRSERQRLMSQFLRELRFIEA